MFDIRYHHCTFHYQGYEVLRDITFQIEGRNHTLIHGPIGAGKTMLLKSIAGHLQLKNGAMTVTSNGEELSKTEFHRKVSIVEFAKPGKYFNPANHFYQQRYHHNMEDDEKSKSMTIEGLLKAKGYTATDEKIKSSLEREDLTEHLNSKLIQLSSGQRRKLQLIVSLIELPEILLLDSPYTGLDEHSRNDLNEWLNELVNDHNLQLIMAANVADAPAWIDHRVKLSNGHRATKNHKKIANELEKLFPTQSDNSPSKSLLELQNINISYGQETILDSINWSVKSGERVALIGANGAGKSTLLSLIYADNPKAYSNDVRMFGIRRGHGDSIWNIKKRIGFVSSELHLYYTERYSCTKVIATGFFDTKFVPRKITSEEHTIIKQYAAYFNIEDLLDREYSRTSLGEQRMVLLIRALVKGPELLLLDEPYQAFDAESVKKANLLLNKLMARSSASMVFISHYEDEIPSCIQKVYHLKQGKLSTENHI